MTVIDMFKNGIHQINLVKILFNEIIFFKVKEKVPKQMMLKLELAK